MNPYNILLSNILPIFAEDAHEMVVRIFELVKERGQEIDVEDGFDLYRQLASIRRLFAEALPEYALCPFFCLHANFAARRSPSMWRSFSRASSGNGSG